jgi:hypothetical protein
MKFTIYKRMFKFRFWLLIAVFFQLLAAYYQLKGRILARKPIILTESDLLLMMDYKVDKSTLGPLGNRLRMFMKLFEHSTGINPNPLNINLFRIMASRLFPWLKIDLLHTFNSFSKDGQNGIVMCVGDRMKRNKNAFASAYSTIQAIRSVFNSTLPMEIFFIGDEDLSMESRAVLEKIPGVTTHNLFDSFDQDILGIHGFLAKPYSILASSFQEVILMDSDTNFLYSPDRLFDSSVYKSEGTLFWKDRTLGKFNQSNLI